MHPREKETHRPLAGGQGERGACSARDAAARDGKGQLDKVTPRRIAREGQDNVELGSLFRKAHKRTEARHGGRRRRDGHDARHGLHVDANDAHRLAVVQHGKEQVRVDAANLGKAHGAGGHSDALCGPRLDAAGSSDGACRRLLAVDKPTCRDGHDEIYDGLPLPVGSIHDAHMGGDNGPA